MNHSVIINKKVGEIPARGYLLEALKNCPSVHGVAIQDKEGDKPVLDVLTKAESISIDKLMEMMTAIKDLPAVVTLGKMDQDFDKENDPMPYVFQQAVVNEDGTKDVEDILAIFVEGDAPNYAKVGEGHSETYNLWEDFIFPTLLEKFEDAGCDVDAFYKKLRSSVFQQQMLNVFHHRGVVVFVPRDGEIIAYGKNEIGGEFPWGTTSNHFNWTGAEGIVAKATATVSAVAGKAKSRLAAITGSSTVTPPAEPAIKTDNNGVHHIDPPKTDTAVKVPAPAGTTAMKPPTKLQGNAKNAWIRLMGGFNEGPMPVGHNHADFVVHVPNSILEFAKKDVSTKDQVTSMKKDVAKALAKAPISNDAIAAAHDEATKVNDQKETIQDPKKTGKPEVIDYLPEITANDKKKTVDLVTEWATLPKRPSVLDVQKIESKWPKFTTSMGIELKDMLGWTMVEKKKFCRELPDAAALAMSELALWAIDHGALEAEEVSVTKTKPDTDYVRTDKEVQPAAPATPPVKRSRLAAITGKAA